MAFGLTPTRRQQAALFALMLGTALGVGAIAEISLFAAAFAQKKQALLDIVHSQANLLSATAHDGNQIDNAITAFATLEGLGRSGELSIGRVNGALIERVLLGRRATATDAGSGGVTVDWHVMSEPQLGEAMRRALRGESDVIIAADFRGAEVLAAFTYLPSLGYGLVAKTNIAEMRGPLLTAVAQTTLAAVVLALIAASLFLRMSGALVRRLEASEARLTAIVDSAAEGIITSDNAGRITSANAAAERLFGYRGSDLLGAPLSRLLPGLAAAGEQDVCRGLPVGERCETYGRRGNGSAFPVELAMSQVGAGSKAFFTGIVHDITDRRRAEQAMRDANEALERRVAERTAELERSNCLLRAVGSVQRSFITGCAGYETLLTELLTLAQGSAGAVLLSPPAAGQPPRTVAERAMPQAGTFDWERLRAGDPTGDDLCAAPLALGDETVGVVVFQTPQTPPEDLLGYLEPFLSACAHAVHAAERDAERERTRQQLLDYESELNALLLNIKDVILRTDLDGTITWVSPSVEQQCGFPCDVLMGRPVADLLAEPDSALRLRDALTTGGGQVRDFEARLRRADGGEFWGSANWHYRYNEAGRPIAMEGVVRDISVKRQAMQRVEVLNRLYSVLSDVNQAIVRCQDRRMLCDEICRIVVEKGRFRMAWIGALDESGRYVTPMSAAGHVGTYLDGFRVDLDCEVSARGPTAAALRSGRYAVVDDIAADPRMATWRADALTHGYAASAAFPLRAGGQVVGALSVYAPDAGFFHPENIALLNGLSDDVSYAFDMFRAEQQNAAAVEELRALSEKLTHLIRHTPLAVIETDAQLVVRQWNPAAATMFAYSPDSIIGRPVAALFPAEEQADAAAALRRLMTGPGSDVVSRDGCTCDGRRLNCEWYGTALGGADGRVTGLILMANDITELVLSRNEALALNSELERRVHERTGELERLNKELEAFSYSVSHDLRAPLRSIDGFSGLLLRRYQHALAPTAADYLSRVRAASQRMGELIDDLLELSRVTRSELRRTRIDLSAMAEAALAELRQLDPERRVRCRVAPGLRADADPRLMRLVIANLLANAWKFTSRLEIAEIHVGLINQAGESVFFVRDNGAGFDMAYAGKLFAAFQRLHAASDFEGTGIGLATVQRVIHRHGGRIWPDAAPGRGATFYFTLSPAAEAEQHA